MRATIGSTSDTRDRFLRNLLSSQGALGGTGSRSPEHALEVMQNLPQAEREEDPGTAHRRRQEKNFSELFGSQNTRGEREKVRQRRDVTATAGCHFLDSRVEASDRNQNGVRKHLSPQGRKQAEQQSKVFDGISPRTVAWNAAEAREGDEKIERICWDTKHPFSIASEVARRAKKQEFHDEQPGDVTGWTSPSAPRRSPLQRKHADQSSSEFRARLGASPEPRAHPLKSRHELTDPQIVKPGMVHPRALAPATKSPAETKMAFLQSSILGQEN